MGTELDRSHAARSRHTRRDSAGESCDSDFDRRRNHRLLMFAPRRRSLGQKGRPVRLFSRPTFGADDVYTCHRIQPRGSRRADYGIFCFRGHRRFRDLFSRIVSYPIRATAQGFCFNFARFFAAAGPLLAGLLTAAHGSFAPAIATIGSIYFVGLIILIFARETKGQALPD